MAKSTKLPQAPPDEPEPIKASSAGRKQADAIRAGVLAVLGRPTKLFRVAVLPLWDNHFRVNVLTGEDVSAVVIPNSYFVTAADDGKILGSTPPLKKLY